MGLRLPRSRNRVLLKPPACLPAGAWPEVPPLAPREQGARPPRLTFFRGCHFIIFGERGAGPASRGAVVAAAAAAATHAALAAGSPPPPPPRGQAGALLAGRGCTKPPSHARRGRGWLGSRHSAAPSSGPGKASARLLRRRANDFLPSAAAAAAPARPASSIPAGGGGGRWQRQLRGPSACPPRRPGCASRRVDRKPGKERSRALPICTRRTGNRCFLATC